MNGISAVISAWNEQKIIERVLQSVKWADEIILIDSGSTDDTGRLAKKYGATVTRRLNNPMLNVNKNFGFGKAKGPWILSLDADEEIPSDLAEEIQHVVSAPSDISGYWIARKNIIFGKWIEHGLWWPDKQLRLFLKDKGKFPEKHVHEYVQVEGKTEALSHAFVHYNYESVVQFLRKLDLYTDNEKQNLVQTNYQLSWYDAIRFPLSDFVKVYFAQQGYKDGLHGLVLALFQSFYSFVVFAKLWEHADFPERDIPLGSVTHEFSRGAKEMNYWMDTAEIAQTKNPFHRLAKKMKRKISQLS